MPTGVYFRTEDTKRKIAMSVRNLWQDSKYREHMIKAAKESGRKPPSRKGANMEVNSPHNQSVTTHDLRNIDKAEEEKK